MLGKAAVVMALTASCLLTGVPPGLAGSKSSPGTTPQAGWYDADSNAAHSRANLAEKVLTPSAVTKVRVANQRVSQAAAFMPSTHPRARASGRQGTAARR